MPIFKTLEETYLNGDTLYNFGGYAPGNLFPPVPYNNYFCMGSGLAGASSAAFGGLSINSDNNGGFFLVGNFIYYRDFYSPSIVKITSNGDADQTFNSPQTGQANFRIWKAKPSSTFPSKIYVANEFQPSSFGWTNAIQRLNSDGSIDTTFSSGSSFQVSTAVFDFVELSGGSLIIVGTFISVSGVSRNKIAKLNSDGSLDTTFQVGDGFGSGAANAGYKILLSPDEQYVYVCGSFTTYSGIARTRLVKINATTGVVDNTFNPSYNNQIFNIDFDGNGNIWVAGSYTNRNGINYIDCIESVSGNSITAITQNFGVGTTNIIIDLRYDPQTNRVILLLNNGANTINGTTFYGRICALDADTGLIDTTFGSTTDTNYGFENIIGIFQNAAQSLFIDEHSNIFIPGLYDSFSNQRYDKFIRLDQNGQPNVNTDC